MKRKCITIILMLVMLFSLVTTSSLAASKATQVSIDDVAVCYTPQSDYKSGDCILTATKVMIRRASIMRGSTQWSTISNKTLRSSATIVGLLLHKFTFEADGLAYRVNVGFFKGKTDAARVKEFEALIKEHPEGVVVWGKNASVFGMHGVLLTDVKGGTPYVMDSWYNLGPRQNGIQKWSDSSMKAPSLCTQYWLIKEIGLAKKAAAPANGKPLVAASATNVNPESTLTITDKTIPTEITEGNGFGVEGVIISNYRLSDVTVQIIDSAGTAVISKTVNPGAWCYDLLNLDSSIKFGTLAPGSYTYQISATDEQKSLVLAKADFKVNPKPVSAASALKISSVKAPTTIYQGDGFSISGKITSNYKISQVTVSVVDQSGRPVLSASANPNAKSYNVSKLDARIKFGALSAGTYTYKVAAQDSEQTSTLVSRQFEVVKKPSTSSLKIASYNYPKTLKKGKGFTIKGKIKSNKKISSVKVQVLDSNGKTVLSASAKPKAKSYQVKKLDKKIKFGKLKKGTYTYRVIAKDSVQTLTLVSRAFTVK
ncbi:MAG: T9SS type A sorting domain-containing protein [Mogibacterium sp.]|nr:T9SS type A sorting domain-containing protein [Mogibacterium sp.]